MSSEVLQDLGEATSDQVDRSLSESRLDTNIMLEAGAGTGKTTVMVERIYQLLATGTTTIDRIAAITFTDKAASELRDRIRVKLDQAPSTAYVRAARNELPGARITTVHSFASSIIRERPIEAGISPDPKMLNKVEASVLFEESWNDWLSTMVDSSPAALRRAVMAGLRISDIKSLALVLYQNRDLISDAGVQSGGGQAAAAQRIMDSVANLKATISSLLEFARTCADPADSGRLNIEEVASDIGRIELSGVEAEHQILNLGAINCSLGNKKNWTPEGSCQEQKERLKSIRAELNDLQQKVRSEIILDLISWLTGFVAFIGQAKTNSGSLDFQDLLILARNLLRDNLEVRRYFQDQFDALLVDEFQDTDPLQAEIAFFIAEQKPVASRWIDVQLEPGKLFVVGDPKQSIYRFRRADIELYELVKSQIQADGASYKITRNFRSRPEIIDWVNVVFRRLIKRPPGGGSYQPDYQDLHPGRQDAQVASGHPPVIALGPPKPSSDDQPMRSSQIRSAEAAHIASLIVRAVQTEHWKIGVKTQRSSGELQGAIRYKDISILLPQFTNVEIYEEQLQAHGIPYLLDGGKQYFQREELRIISAAISSIADPGDEIALIATLRSFLFGVSDEHLLLYRKEGGSFNYLMPGIAPALKHPQIFHAFEVLAHIHTLQHKMSPASLIRLFLKRTGAIEISASRPRGTTRIQNLLKTVELARSFGSAPEGRSLSAFSYWLEKMEKSAPDEPDPILHSDSADAVRILTIHKSKGLEAHMVILADIASSEKMSRDRLLICRNNAGEPGLEASIGSKERGYFCTPGYESLLASEQDKIEAQKIRLFYVAATRARDYLAISLYGATDKDGRLQGFHRYLTEESLSIPFDQPPSDTPRDESAGIDGEMPVKPMPEGHSEAAAALTQWRDNMRRALILGARVTTTNASELKGQAPPNSIRAAGEAAKAVADQGASLGSALHEVLEQAGFGETSDLEAIVSAKAEKWGLTQKAKTLLAELIRNVMGSEVIRRARSSKGLHKEIPFTVPITLLDETEKPFQVKCEGKIDLLFEDNDGQMVIVDYKSDRKAGEALFERFTGPYRLQGQIYAEAVRQSTGKNVKEVIFLFARSGEIRSLTGEELAFTPPPLPPSLRSTDPQPSESLP